MNFLTDEFGLSIPTRSTAELFAAGDYASAAMRGHPDEWQTYAALGLIGRAKDAIDGLERFGNPEARFYSAVASWIDGDEATAVQALESIHTPHAQNLLALVRRPQIQVLAQMDRHGWWDLMTAASQDTKFRIQNLGFQPQDLPNEPYADIHKFYDPHRPPDFYISKMLEWHVIPPNLQELPCPIIGHTQDYDLHVQTVFPWLQVFDELVVADHTEWRDVCRLVRAPVSTFPKTSGVPDTLPPVPQGPREVDFFLSGTMLHPYHPDKEPVVRQVLAIPNIRVLFINGFIDRMQYFELLGRSKVSLTYVRHPGATHIRALETLSMGCAVVAQKGSALTLYVGEHEGVLTYRYDSNDLPAAIHRILAEWPVFQQRAQQGAAIMRREFSMSRVASQYFRFLTVLAARPRGPRRRQTAARLDQKRSIARKGWYLGPAVYQAMREKNLARWGARLGSTASPRLIIDTTRELALELATGPHAERDHADHQIAVRGEMLARCLKLYRIGLEQFPKSLVLRFNMIRTALHFGQPRDVSETLQLALEALDLPVGTWQIDVMEDVFPWDFFSQCFNYRKYFDLITTHLQEETPVGSSLRKLILASLHHYVSFYTRDPEHARQAVFLDTDFPFYKLQYARQLIQRGRAEDYRPAAATLVELVESSMLFNEAFALLERLHAQGLYRVARLGVLAEQVQRARHRTHRGADGAEDWSAVPLQPAEFLSEALRGSQSTDGAPKSASAAAVPGNGSDAGNSRQRPAVAREERPPQSLSECIGAIRAAIQTRDFVAAERCSGEVIHRYYQDPSSWLCRAMVLRALGRYAEAVEAVEKSLHRGETPDALVELARIYTTAGLAERAQEVTDLMRRKYPRSPEPPRG